MGGELVLLSRLQGKQILLKVGSFGPTPTSIRVKVSAEIGQKRHSSAPKNKVSNIYENLLERGRRLQKIERRRRLAPCLFS
jgi:hypothetical protein